MLCEPSHAHHNHAMINWRLHSLVGHRRFLQAANEVDRAVREGQEQCLLAQGAELTGDGCDSCGHLTVRLAASERRAGALARSLDELRSQVAFMDG